MEQTILYATQLAATSLTNCIVTICKAHGCIYVSCRILPFGWALKQGCKKRVKCGRWKKDVVSRIGVMQGYSIWDSRRKRIFYQPSPNFFGAPRSPIFFSQTPPPDFFSPPCPSSGSQAKQNIGIFMSEPGGSRFNFPRKVKGHVNICVFFLFPIVRPACTSGKIGHIKCTSIDKWFAMN